MASVVRFVLLRNLQVLTQLPRPSTPSQALQLDPHVQFIYELALARLELRRFGVEFDINPTLNIFRTVRLPDPIQLFERTAYITAIDQAPTRYALLRKYNRTRSINQYLTHWFYPYKGKFHPQMARALLNIMQLNPGNTVLDPFIGSGTTAVEAQLLGLRCIGVDISPLCIPLGSRRNPHAFWIRCSNTSINMKPSPVLRPNPKHSLRPRVWKNRMTSAFVIFSR